MTNPFAVILLQAFEAYRKISPNPNPALASALAYRQTIPKALLYTVGTTLIATAIYKTLKNRNTTSSFNFLTTILKPFKYLLNKQPPTTQEIPFEDKYFKEYDEWVSKQPSSLNDDNYVMVPALTTDKKECLENLYNTTIRERIDDFYADVIMCYDYTTFSFAYYARTANIPYKYLETISRKYMIETNAPREIHIDIRDEYKKAKERNVTVAPDTTSMTPTDAAAAVSPTASPDADDDNIFVKLKSYNTVSNLNIHTTTSNDTKEKTHKFVTPNTSASVTTSDSSNPSTTNKIIREKANRYSYRGKIHEFEETHKRTTAAAAAATTAPATTAAAEEVKGYTEFKKQMMKTRSAL
jgi:hypothetical protein